MTSPCRFIEMDSIVVRDWSLLEDTRSYEPARYIFHGPAIWAAAEYEYPGRPVRHRSGGPDPHVVREAWPCSPRMLGYYNARDRFRERRLPVPRVPEVEIRADVEVRIEALDLDGRRLWTLPLRGSAPGPPGQEFQPARLLLSLGRVS